jgi:diketogulonate reductase-like aldo/keto reductase
MAMEVVELADGNKLPLLGLGVWQVKDGKVCEDAVRWALELGYRHIDTAQAYRNEASVGRALKDSGVARDEVFITTKFNPGIPFSPSKDPAAELEKSLRRLGLDQVDLYLVHWPRRGPLWAWPGMERALERGLTKSIGVSNYSAAEVDAVVAAGGAVPVVDQVQFSAMEYRRGLLSTCQRHNVVLEAYSPLGTGKHLRNGTVAEIAGRAGRTPAQVLLRWCLQHGVPVIPKSTHRDRIAANARLFDFTLADADMAALDALDRTSGASIAREIRWWR